MFDWLGSIVEYPIAGSLKWIAGGLKNVLLEIFRYTIIPLLNNVMAYQNFFSEGVNNGWDIVRNFSNLFFALVLLLIAISTVLGIGALDNYTAKRMLPNFIFVALFINFSKAIVGLLIDISQIIMVSFYNSFGPSMTNVIGNASKIAEAAAESNTEDLTINIFTIVIIAFLAFVLLWTALILAMRIVTLWFVIMLSPLAFMSSLIPGLRNINSEWTKSLQEALITGPTLMFLLYLGFAVMSQGISANTTTTGDNLVNNGNLINYVLVVGLIWFANTTASKAAQAAPPMLKNAVGVAGTVATFGIGKYVGAGGYGTKQFADTSVGGVTTIFGQNTKYEAAKKDFKDRQASGTGIFGKPKINGKEYNINPFRLARGLSDEGKKNIQQEYDIEYAKKLAAQGNIDAPANERYKKLFNAERARETKELEESGLGLVDLRTKFYEAMKKNDLLVAQSTLLQIDKIGELGNISKYHDGVSQEENDYFARIAQENETDGAILETIVSDMEKSSNGNATKSSLYRNFRTSLKRVGSDKKGQSFVSNIDTPLSDPSTLPQRYQQNINNMSRQDIIRANAQNNANNAANKIINSGILNGIDNINNNPNVMRKRKVDPVTNLFEVDPVTKKPVFEPNDTQILAFIDKQKSIDTLEDHRTWNRLNDTSATEFLQVLNASTPNANRIAAKKGLTS